MKITAAPSYNLDILCFMNTLTSDDYYVKRHAEAYGRFYPLLSKLAKAKIKEAVEVFKTSMLSPTVTLLVSSLRDFNTRDLAEMLLSASEIKEQINQSPYRFSEDELTCILNSLADHFLPVIGELEQAGFKEFRETQRLPYITVKCEEINGYFTKFDIKDLIACYKDFNNEDIIVYICSFASPHGIKLCGNSLISDYTYPRATILANVTHEMFHPPYDHYKVRSSIEALSKKLWVIDAFNAQDPNSGYTEMEGFIEENVVEALGTYVVYRMGVEKEPLEYFKTHDGGSHVISPKLFLYLLENPKQKRQSFESYFNGFVSSLD